MKCLERRAIGALKDSTQLALDAVHGVVPSHRFRGVLNTRSRYGDIDEPICDSCHSVDVRLRPIQNPAFLQEAGVYVFGSAEARVSGVSPSQLEARGRPWFPIKSHHPVVVGLWRHASADNHCAKMELTILLVVTERRHTERRHGRLLSLASYCV